MRREKQKEIERSYVEWFIQQIGWKPSLIIDDEEPDFGIKFKDKTVGLEVTSLYKDDTITGSLRRRKESLQSKFLSCVSKEYYKLSSIPIRVYISGQFGELDCNPQISKIIASKLVERNNLKVREEIKFETELYKNCRIIIWLKRLPDEFKAYNRWIFIDNHVGWSREIDEAYLLKKIENKASRLPSYKKKYNEIYLLLIADRTRDSGMFHISRDLIIHTSYGFSGIFWALYPERCIKIS